MTNEETRNLHVANIWRHALAGTLDKMWQAQRESWCRGEMALGSDAEEVAYQRRVAEGNY